GWSGPRLRDRAKNCCRTDSPPESTESKTNWAAGLFVQHCQGSGPAGPAGLPPCLPLTAPTSPFDAPNPSHWVCQGSIPPVVVALSLSPPPPRFLAPASI